MAIVEYMMKYNGNQIDFWLAWKCEEKSLNIKAHVK